MLLVSGAHSGEGDRDSSVGIATSYGLVGPGIESQWGEIFRTLPDRPWVSPSLLHDGYCVFPAVKRPGRGCDHSPPSRRARELISGSSLVAKARFLSFNRTQSRAVTGLLTGHNTLRRHLHLIGLSDSPLCRRCEAERESSAHILCESEALVSHGHVHLGSFLEPEDIKSINLGVIWNFSKVTGLP